MHFKTVIQIEVFALPVSKDPKAPTRLIDQIEKIFSYSIMYCKPSNKGAAPNKGTPPPDY